MQEENVILIVDDDVTTVRVIAELLRSHGRILFATNAQQAMQIIDREIPSVIILDVNLPGFPNNALAADLSKIERLKTVPIISISADPDAELDCLVNGSTDFISKPFHGDVLVARVVTQMKMRGREIALQRTSHIDALTGIPNRRAFEEAIIMECERSVRNNEQIALAMVDVDNLKPVNDIQGHQSGDALIQNVARILKSKLRRPGDMVCRFGGDEFALILPNTHIDGAAQVVEEILETVRAETETTVSIGLATATFGQNGLPLKQLASVLLKASDICLYKSKKAGKNTIKIAAVVYTETPPDKQLGVIAEKFLLIEDLDDIQSTK